MNWKTMLGLAFILTLLAPTALRADEARVLRFPTIHQDQIVFSYAGDLYSVSSQGGVARRITSHVGYEVFPRFSPDGEHIAFTAEYDGNREVFLIPAIGGSPQRLTFTPTLSRDSISDRMGPNNLVIGWKDNARIVFRSRMREHNSFNGQLYLGYRDGGTPTQIPLPRGGFCSYSADGTKFAYNRVFREFRTWKRYRGGMADDIWIHDFVTKETINITNNRAQDIIPMWSGSRIYFLSDRDSNKRMNLYVHDLESDETRRLTSFSEFDIKFPSIGPKAIVFEYGGYLYRLDLLTEQTKRVPVTVADDTQLSRTTKIKVDDQITNYEVSPSGNRALFGARGEVFSIPKENGKTRNLTNTSGVHERNAKWSPDGRHIAYISDKSGNDEIYIVAQDGEGTPDQLTSTGDTYLYQQHWAPDSKKILWSDKMLRVRYVDLESKEIVDVAKAKAWEIRDPVWSPDSGWISWSQQEDESMSKVYLYSVKNRETHEVTDGWYSSSSPAFGSDGKYLFFQSSRDFSPTYSNTEWNHSYSNMSRLYFIPLAKKTPSPFDPESDEAVIKDDDEAKEDEEKSEDDDEKDEEKETDADSDKIVVDVEGLKERIIGLPVPPGNYRSIASVGDVVYYQYSRSGSRGGANFKMYDLKAEKESDLGSIGGYEISADGEKMLVSQNGSYGIIDLPRSAVKIDKPINTSAMMMNLDRKQEWLQIYNECWRQMRDFFYVANMHGVNWGSLRQRYKPLAEAVQHRNDLTYIIGELIGELNVGHAYVGGGDVPSVDKTMRVGALGAELERDTQSGYYKITRILRGQNWPGGSTSPLRRVGIDVAVGEYLIAVDGKSTKEMTDVHESLLGTVGQQTTLSVNKDPMAEGSRDVVVIPIRDDLSLYYYNWVQDNIEKVDQATEGRVGYIHIPNMGVNGLNEFVKHYYPQLRKEALIIDVRGNGGGNVSPMITERLLRTHAMYSMSRNTSISVNPGGLHVGPKVCLLDEFSASDGDIFPFRFRHYGIGTLIGKRSWGGVVGIRGSLPLVDGGSLNRPEFASFSIDGKEWVMEGHGVDPDIVVENDPAKEFAGIDEQLNKGIEVALAELEKNPVKYPDAPADPVKRD